MSFIIDREKFKTELGRIIYDKLVSISNDQNFLISVLYEIKGDERKKDLLDWLDKNPKATADEIVYYVEEKYND